MVLCNKPCAPPHRGFTEQGLTTFHIQKLKKIHACSGKPREVSRKVIQWELMQPPANFADFTRRPFCSLSLFHTGSTSLIADWRNSPALKESFRLFLHLYERRLSGIKSPTDSQRLKERSQRGKPSENDYSRRRTIESRANSAIFAKSSCDHRTYTAAEQQKTPKNQRFQTASRCLAAPASAGRLASI